MQKNHLINPQMLPSELYASRVSQSPPPKFPTHGEKAKKALSFTFKNTYTLIVLFDLEYELVFCTNPLFNTYLYISLSNISKNM